MLDSRDYPGSAVAIAVTESKSVLISIPNKTLDGIVLVKKSNYIFEQDRKLKILSLVENNKLLN